MKVVIAGVGLIGGSIGMALRQNIQATVLGLDLSPETIQEAISLGAIDSGATVFTDEMAEADLYVVAVPVGQIVPVVKQLLPRLKPGAVLTDTGSTKYGVVHDVEELLPEGIHFVGGHPMAGKEAAGVRASDPNILENAFYLLTPTEHTSSEALSRVLSMVHGAGAIPHILPVGEHDRLVAAVSHLPHVVASSLVNTVLSLSGGDHRFWALAAGGFRDTTRIAGSDPYLWKDILLHNREAVIASLEVFTQQIRRLGSLLEAGDETGLVEYLSLARQTRASIPLHQKGLLEPILDLFVQISDHPGAISQVTGLLGRMGINIHDIEIIHVREPEAGSLRLGFSDEEARSRAAEQLAASGYFLTWPEEPLPGKKEEE